MSEQAWLTLAQIIGAGLAGFFVARYTNIAQRKIRKISYIRNSIELLKLHEKTPDGIQINARKSLLTGDSVNSSEWVPIQSAYAHSITLKNRGNEAAENLVFNIVCDESATIISHNTIPEAYANNGVEVRRPENKSNVLEVSIVYMNPNEPLVISLVGSGEAEDNDLTVVGGGKGVEVEEFLKDSETGFYLNTFITFILFLGVALFFDSPGDSFGNLLPENWINVLGGAITLETVKIAEFPFTHKVVASLIGVLMAIAVWFRYFQKKKF